MTQGFKRIAIVNRGEAAMRLIHAVRELRRESGEQLVTIALYTEPDRRAMFVREADEAVGLGPATFEDPRDGERKNRYLDYDGLRQALESCRAQAVWAGWGFVAEHAAFVDMCDELGVVFIGPSSDVMRRLGDKIASKLLAEQAGVPVAPWSGGAVKDEDEARAQAERIGYPLMIKATAGGGGRGIRRVTRESELGPAFQSASSEALKAFGNADVFLERLVEGARHVEVQVIADHHGHAWGVGVRDCSIQRRNQKVLEETPSPALTEEQDRELREAAVRLCVAAGYQNAGTVEFLYEPESRQFSFMEVNARLQVEHPITELATDLDLVKLQIHVARGGRLEGSAPPATGHAIEVRLNAEDADREFAPAPGRIDFLRWPTGPGIRIDTGVEEGDEIPAEFDSMIAKVMARGRDRREALARLRRALSLTTLAVDGGTTNKAFLYELLDRPEVVSGELDIGWLDRLIAEGSHVSRRGAQVALFRAAIETYDAELDLEKTHFLASASRGRPEAKGGIGRQVELTYQGVGYDLTVLKLDSARYQIEIDGRRTVMALERLGRAGDRLLWNGRYYSVFTVVRSLDFLVEVDEVSHRVGRERGGMVRAPAPAVVVSIDVREGDEVAAGDRLLSVEAMKMEMSIVADFAGTVSRVLVRKNVQVEAGARLLILEPSGDQQAASQGERIELKGLETVPDPELSPDLVCQRNLADLRSLMLGYDIDSRELNRLVTEHGAMCRDVPAADPVRALNEERVLEIFADVCGLFRREPSGDDLDGFRRSSEELLFAYLRNLDPTALPAGFSAKLAAAVGHYGVESLERTPELEEALFRIFKSHQRMDHQIVPILSILERQLEALDEVASLRGEKFRSILDRIIEVTVWSHSSVHDLANQVHYRLVDQPFLEEVRERAYADAERALTALTQEPTGSERAAHVQALVDCPRPLVRLLSERLDGAGGDLQLALLEGMTRRYYRLRDIQEMHGGSQGEFSFISGEYPYRGRRVFVVSTQAPYEQRDELIAAARPQLERVPDDADTVVDLYLWRAEGPSDANATREEVLASLAELPPDLRRVVVTISYPSERTGAPGMQHFTFRPSERGYREQVLYRNMHPMLSKRLELWRLGNFELDRQPAAEDVYLFHGTAHDVPRDERLFAIAEVRDLSPLRDEDGELERIPQLERSFLEACDAIRAFQAQRPARRRLHWNRIILHVWPPLDLRPGELYSIARRQQSATEGLGLEKVVIRARLPRPDTGEFEQTVIAIAQTSSGHLAVNQRRPAKQPIQPLSDYDQKVVRLRQRGMLYPYELVKMLTGSHEGGNGELPPGEFEEHDLDAAGGVVAVDREPGLNTANIIFGLIRNFTSRYPEGMERAIVLGDPSRGLGNLAEPECRRIIAGIDLAERRGIPLEWFAVSAGAKISMDSGVENMDWIGRVLRRLVEFTQAGGEVNIIVPGINVGAQPYWNAEATMLMHTKGVLIMTREAAMVLTGKQALDYSGGVSAEDNRGIGGYERIMGPNGQAQYFAATPEHACRILMRHYEITYVASGERYPRSAPTSDPAVRDVCGFAHGGDFETVGDVFSTEANPGRKRPFEIRKVMEAVTDQDLRPLERWYGMQDAEVAVVWDAFLGGHAVCLLGLESRPLKRMGYLPADGPELWTSGTLFPLSSKKVARAINTASARRPLVVLANLSGFDGSPESLRKLQLEYGAEIGRAVVNFEGPIVFCVVSRYHGGAFVVFSNTLNDNMEVAALEGSYASVIGGAPAAAVVFAREVRRQAQGDPQVKDLQRRLEEAKGSEKVKLRAQLESLSERVHSEKLGQMAEQFDQVHSIYRAREVGAVHRIIAPSELRPYLIDAVERGMSDS